MQFVAYLAWALIKLATWTILLAVGIAIVLHVILALQA